MTDAGDRSRRLLVGMHDGVCAIRSSDGGKTWDQGSVTPLAHAAARLTVSPAAPQWGYLAAYEAGVYRTEDGGESWRSLETYPSAYAHSVLMHPTNPQEIYVGSEPAAVFRSQDGGETWEECTGFTAVPESSGWSFHGTRLSHGDVGVCAHFDAALALEHRRAAFQTLRRHGCHLAYRIHE